MPALFDDLSEKRRKQEAYQNIVQRLLLVGADHVVQRGHRALLLRGKGAAILLHSAKQVRYRRTSNVQVSVIQLHGDQLS